MPTLRTTLHGNVYTFKDLKELFGKANEEKSGDHLIGIGAKTVSERIAAKIVLAGLTLGEIRDNPLISPDEDEVSRVIEGQVNETVYQTVKSWTVGELRDWLLRHETTATDIETVRRGLTAEMIAAVAKLMSSADLVYGASKMRVVGKCRYEIGKPGTLSYRIQPNHPKDDPAGIRASMFEGLSYASGDCVLGVNPVEDTVANCTRVLTTLYDVMEDLKVPTHICCLAHVSTQMEAVLKGAPSSMFFQSVAGTQDANTDFGVTTELLDEAWEVIKKHGLCAGPNLMYFETGQGSEVSIGADHGVDEMTLEARTYGYAKRYQPFMVNNVSGFIGPETIFDGRQMIRANLEDHFMGKLTGLPMGMAPCYTNHTGIDQNDQEIATMLLAMAGANYYMGVPGGDDVMLSYQDTSYHDDMTLRELLGLTPAKEFFEWAQEWGILDSSGRMTARAGDASIFAKG
ncbi:MAG: ethanolamine ammonia-lyase subunit EutB [Propionibacteriaceae bacterium]|jgi:ethanolamine ammonia-lyase large subunit|nr:ethanolamine ammonia-lyase subunit EutB [Propionibacteriaceae bacterium]